MSATHKLTGLFLVVVLAAGCAEERPIIRLIFDSSGIVPPDHYNILEVNAAASRNEEGLFCFRYDRAFPLSGVEDLPFLIDIEQGEEYKTYAAARVEAKRMSDGETEIVFVWEQGRLEWPSEGIREINLSFGLDCASNRETCAEGQNCVNGECEDIIDPGVFDDYENFEEITCDPAASLDSE